MFNNAKICIVILKSIFILSSMVFIPSFSKCNLCTVNAITWSVVKSFLKTSLRLQAHISCNSLSFRGAFIFLNRTFNLTSLGFQKSLKASLLFYPHNQWSRIVITIYRKFEEKLWGTHFPCKQPVPSLSRDLYSWLRSWMSPRFPSHPVYIWY